MKDRALSLGVWAGLAVSAGGCNAIFGVDELRTEPPVQVSSSAASGTGGGAASSAATGGASQGGNGGAGGCTNCLVDRGLVARYFIDEADSGQAPTALLDAAPGGQPLTIEYGGPGGLLAFSGSPGKRGLQWTNAGTTAKASAPIAGTKLLLMLDGSAQATIEMVVELEDVVLGGSGVAIIGAGDNFGGLSFAVGSNQVGLFWHDGASLGTWNSTIVNAGRLVLHAVLEAPHPDPTMRARFYVNGVSALTNVFPIAQDEVIDLDGDTTFVVGSGVSAARSPKGIIAYVAYYNVAMPNADILANVARLNVSDDAQ